MTRVLLVDDDHQLVRALSINLRARGYDVEAAVDGGAALTAAADRPPDVAIVDLGLPDVDGIDVVRELRARGSVVPIIVLSARHAQPSKVDALDAGADDYVTKPFGMDELLARLRAVLRRLPDAPSGDLVRTDAFVVDLAARQVRTAAGEVRLTATEWNLLEVLVRNQGEVVVQRRLLQSVWGPGYGTESNYLRVFVAQLRRKLEPDPSRPRYIRTEPRKGYRFDP